MWLPPSGAVTAKDRKQASCGACAAFCLHPSLAPRWAIPWSAQGPGHSGTRYFWSVAFYKAGAKPMLRAETHLFGCRGGSTRSVWIVARMEGPQSLGDLRAKTSPNQGVCSSSSVPGWAAGLA